MHDAARINDLNIVDNPAQNSRSRLADERGALHVAAAAADGGGARRRETRRIRGACALLQLLCQRCCSSCWLLPASSEGYARRSSAQYAAAFREVMMSAAAASRQFSLPPRCRYAIECCSFAPHYALRAIASLKRQKICRRKSSHMCQVRHLETPVAAPFCRHSDGSLPFYPNPQSRPRRSEVVTALLPPRFRQR